MEQYNLLYEGPYPYDAAAPNASHFYISGLIDWSSKNLVEINEIPTHCKQLYCDDNNLTSLPPLPMKGQFTFLYCDHNQLNYLPELPDTLIELHCSYNNLTILPDLPNSLIYIYFGDNPLETNYPEIFEILTNISPDDTKYYHTIPEYFQAVIQYVNRRNAMMRAKDRMRLIDPTNQLLERYMRRSMHPSRLAPLLEDTDLDVDTFMEAYVAAL